MKTIEITIKSHSNPEIAKELLKAWYKYILKYDNNFHFLFEPNLILRTSYVREIKHELNKLKLDYKIYDYPYPKKGFGESEKYKTIQKELEKILHLQSICALTYKKRDIEFFSNRLHHCFLNMLGFDYYNESKYYLGEAQGYMFHEYKAEGKPYLLILQKLIYLLWRIT